jgi:hypothetical protein
VPSLRHRDRYLDVGDRVSIPALASLIPDWHRDAACKDEPDERLFFVEVAGATSKPHLAEAALLLSFLICADCPVRSPCLAEAVVPLVIPGFARPGQFGRDVVTETEYPRRFGTWGGTSEYDRVQVRHLPQAEQAAELERTLADRLAERIAAWKAVKGSRAKDGRPKNWTRRDRRIAAMLGLEVPVTPPCARSCRSCRLPLPRMRVDARYCSGRCRARALRARRAA